MNDQRLRVLVADDSPSARRLLVGILDGAPGLRVAGEAADGSEAVRLTERVRPQVIVMDVLMPGLDGLAATRQIMHARPTPIVLVSAGFDGHEAARSFEAMQAGALTLVSKPRGPADPDFPAQAAALATTVRLMADVKLVRRTSTHAARPTTASPPSHPKLPGPRGRVRVAALAASTGGPAALAALLGALPADVPVPILVVQHIAAGFQQGLATWLSQVSPLRVQIAIDGEPLQAGTVLIAPPGRHLGVTRTGRAVLNAGPPIGPHRPSATYLFASLAETYGSAAVGVVLTGMGDDGATGLRALKDAGGLVLAQDEASCVVYGMPGQACALGAVDHVLPLDQLPAALVRAWTAHR